MDKKFGGGVAETSPTCLLCKSLGQVQTSGLWGQGH